LGLIVDAAAAQRPGELAQADLEKLRGKLRGEVPGQQRSVKDHRQQREGRCKLSKITPLTPQHSSKLTAGHCRLKGFVGRRQVAHVGPLTRKFGTENSAFALIMIYVSLRA
jgi:hypothetical protein